MIMKNKILVFLVSLCLVPSSFAANIPMDYMEYSTDGNAQAAYVLPGGSASATGGTITTDDTYTYHTFTSSGTFHAESTFDVQVLVIAGGGSGGASRNGYAGGGGGAGGILYHDDLEVSHTDYTVTVGNGGATQTSTADGNPGEDSYFGSLKAFGGGGGNAYSPYEAGDDGGCGGGGENSVGTSSSTQTSNNGGTGYGTAGGAGNIAGGGGGAGAAGASGDGNYSGDGGAGKNTWSAWATATSTGVDGYYAGGGGGGSSGGTGGYNNTGAGSGGVGGGGYGGGKTSGTGNGQAATANTGGGGGGSGLYSAGTFNGGAGGSGLVIVRYTTPSTGVGISTEGTIKTQGSYSLKIVADETTSLSKAATKTVTPTLNLSDQKILKFDIRSSRTGSNIKIGIHDSGGTTTETTPNVASANTWQTVVWDISSVSNANKDGIDSIVITIVNADSANTFYLDNFRCSVVNDVFGIIE